MKKILIVDDEEKVRRLVEVTLSIGKFDILHASSGEEALKIARESKPDIMLLDIMMPGKLDGFDVCRLLKKDPDIANIYIIMLTAKGQKVDKEKGLALGADDYFVKPFSPMELIDKIDRVLA
ncbi:MAG: response regulator [Deltaproteobacteria bacterium]|nr:response regulator [Deltaproteobacteria bacterium]MBW2020003.1 response regulator [Deltaproteobacteria bacterium]MBW2074819.1 response regulator [Deltaproteobacteria bacterium]RLB82077.1 MAG: two-component system response regulator [Deltaproteobacteria bacterium]